MGRGVRDVRYRTAHLHLTVVNVVQQRGRVLVGQRPRGELFPSTLVHGQKPTVGQPFTVMGDRLEQHHLAFGQQPRPSPAPVVRGRIV